MTRRPEEGYQVRSRIGARPSRRGRIATILVVLGAFAWAAATLTARPPVTADATRAPTARSSLRPGETARPTFPPSIEVRPGAPTKVIPMLLRGSNRPQPGDASQPGDSAQLAWLDPRLGSPRIASGNGWSQRVFLHRDGATLCVCVEPAESEDRLAVLHLMQYDPGGVALGDVVVPDWPGTGPGDDLLLGAALEPGGRFILLATAIHDVDGWSVRLDRFSGAHPVGGTLVGKVSEADLADSFIRELDLWIAPDGAHARVRLGTWRNAPDPHMGPGAWWSWLVPIVDGMPAAPRPQPSIDNEREAIRCMVEGWATPADFVSVCAGFDDQTGEASTRVAVQSVDGTPTSADIPAPQGFGFDTSAWILDGSAGVAYGYDSGTNHAYRVAIPGLEVRGRELPRPNPAGAFEPEAARPDAAENRASWQGGPPTSLWMTPIVGSPDGRLLYVAGTDLSISSYGPVPVESTGIWVLDAGTLAVVDHWRPEANYLSVGLTPDNRYLMSFGSPPNAELQAFGNHGPVLTFHDTGSGAAVLLIRSAVQQLGSEPYFLVPGPAP